VDDPLRVADLPQQPALTRDNLVEQLFVALPGQRERFDAESWQYEQPDGTYGYYGVVEEYLTRGCIVAAITGGDDSDLAQACRFVERMLASDDDEVQGAAAISVGEPLGWTEVGLARALFAADGVTLPLKELVWPYASAARDTPDEWRAGPRPFS
jgi:hypothetical protein